ncbi:MAG: hypothetical protein L3J82_05165 [Planctomycetes bacterium]|nr:hypothetical protein [Planctomycetota bacterium]
MLQSKRNIHFAMLLGWLVPGLGHFFVKRYQYGILYSVLIIGLFAMGEIISGGTAVNLQVHQWYFYCQMGAGPMVLGLEAMAKPEFFPLGQEITILQHQSGVVYGAVAGVLNLITICELYRRNQNPEAVGPSDTMRVDAVGIAEATTGTGDTA